MLTRDLTPCFVQSFSVESKTGYEKALLVGIYDKTFTDLDRCISSSDRVVGPTRRPVAVVMRRDGRLQEVEPWKVVIDDSEEVFEMYSWMWDEESVKYGRSGGCRRGPSIGTGMCRTAQA